MDSGGRKVAMSIGVSLAIRIGVRVTFLARPISRLDCALIKQPSREPDGPARPLFPARSCFAPHYPWPSSDNPERADSYLREAGA
jgi:hypothetical protein